MCVCVNYRSVVSTEKARVRRVMVFVIKTNIIAQTLDREYMSKRQERSSEECQIRNILRSLGFIFL